MDWLEIFKKRKAELEAQREQLMQQSLQLAHNISAHNGAIETLDSLIEEYQQESIETLKGDGQNG